MPAPRLVFLPGPNGAGKSTYYRTFLSASGLPFVNADELTRALGVPNTEAAKFADGAREAFRAGGESFITETVFSDPVGAKLDFLRRAMAAGYDVQVHFIGISGADLSEARVMQRVAQGGHDVPSYRLERHSHSPFGTLPRQSPLCRTCACSTIPTLTIPSASCSALNAGKSCSARIRSLNGSRPSAASDLQSTADPATIR